MADEWSAGMSGMWGLCVYPFSAVVLIMVPPLRRVFPTAEKVTKKAVLLVGPFLRQGSFTPVSLRGPASNGHPCPDGALAASMPLGPLRETCVQPAPKSRLVVPGLIAYEDQKRIKSFPAEAGPTVGALPRVVRGVLFSGTGFSREGASRGADGV
jgi:hypothetical protein